MFAGDYTNYYAPSEFINSHRKLNSGNRVATVVMNNFAMPTFGGVPALAPVNLPSLPGRVLSDSKGKSNEFHWGRFDDLAHSY